MRLAKMEITALRKAMLSRIRRFEQLHDSRRVVNNVLLRFGRLDVTLA